MLRHRFIEKAARPRYVQVRALAQPPVRFNIHGRHVEVTEQLERHVKEKLAVAFTKFKGAEYIEAEGGIREVDVKLMNSEVQLVLHPLVQNKAMHDTYLRQGEIKVIEFGNNVYDSLDKAVATLEKKLHKYKRPAPVKTNYRKQ